MKRILCIMVALLIAAPALAFDIPKLQGRVNDYANLLNAGQITALSNKLLTIEASSGDGSQVVVLTLPTLDGESIDKIKNDVFHEWKLGQAGKDNGVLIVIAPIERKIGIEVGYGLEPFLTDGTTKRITEEKIKPNLKKGAENWYAALDAGAAAVGDIVLARQNEPANPKTSSQKIFWAAGFVVVGLIAAFLSFGAMVSRQRKREQEDAARLAAVRRRASETARQGYPDAPQPTLTPVRRAAAAGVGAAAGAALASKPKPRPDPPRRRTDDSPSRSSSSSDSSSSYGSSSSSSDSGSSISGGGGDSGGGGSSSDF